MQLPSMGQGFPGMQASGRYEKGGMGLGNRLMRGGEMKPSGDATSSTERPSLGIEKNDKIAISDGKGVEKDKTMR